MTNLRPYQKVVIVECDQVIANGKRRPLIVAPTGAGKTVIAAAIIQTAMAQQRRVLVLGHTREIIKQTSLKLSGYQVEHGIIQADLVGDVDQSVQVASIQTLWSRAMRSDRMALPAADVLIIDEAHAGGPPMKEPPAANDNLIDRTIAVWQPRLRLVEWSRDEAPRCRCKATKELSRAARYRTQPMICTRHRCRDRRRFRPPPDPKSRSPGAATSALGAPGKDQLGRQVTSKNSLLRNLPQALIGSNFGSIRRVADEVINDADGVGGGL
jgi:hypothetical protein